MAHEVFGRDGLGFARIVSADDEESLAHRVLHGLGGLVLLLGVGVVILVMVLWQTPV